MTTEQMKANGYFAAFGDTYRFLQRYGGGVTDWDTVAAESRTIAQAHERTPAGKLTNALLLAVLDELERRHG